MRLFLYTVLVVLPGLLFGQESGYTHYESKDGLAGSTVYCMVQDAAGFMWFGTETGLCRFDGTHFKNFTREDGLPDNEIVQLFADSKGRVWIAPFKRAVCYYYKGKIHSPDNDPVLRRIHPDDFVIRFAEDKAGNILIQSKKLHLVETSGRVSEIDTIDSQPMPWINTICAREDDGFRILANNKLYDYRKGRFTFKEGVPFRDKHFIYFAMDARLLVSCSYWQREEKVFFEQKKMLSLQHRKDHIRFAIIDDSLVGECCTSGAAIYNLKGTDSTRYFLQGLPVSSMLKDYEGNFWFGTLGHGLYKLSSLFVSNVKLKRDNMPAQVFTLTRYGETVLAGTEVNILFRFNAKTGRFEKGNIFVQKFTGTDPVYAILVYKEKNLICGSSSVLYKMGEDFKKQAEIPFLVVKGLCLNGDKLYVAGKDYVFKIDARTWKISDSLWKGRSTSVFASHDTVYIGTLNGLYCRLPDGGMQFLGEKTLALQTRITAIQPDVAGVLWIGTYGDGIVGYKDGRVVATINRHNGLSSNVCRALFLEGNHLWAGTDKGINKINISQPGMPITKYTTSDGLATDIVNALYVDSNKVFVGTPEGITFFDEQKIINQSHCDLYFTDVTIGGASCPVDSLPALIAHNKNGLRFDYVGISYKSNGDIRYRYRLLGLDTAWQETRETFLSYPTLPSGDYLLQLQAINKFDVHSQLLTASFTIDKRLYERNWFRILIGLLFISGTGLLVWFIIRRIRKREQEKTAISKRISELEQLSRKAQMNPHFIFNSLNSIQQYVMDSDVTGANKFISGFSRLIRQTLDFSSKPEISLEEELDYLSNYLELEKTRLENAFTWSVAIDKNVDPAEHYIPPMILQPFVENSVRHGLRYRRDKNGKVTITVKRVGDHLVCVVEDNGIGRRAAMEYKSITPINYQSKGLSLTADRITMYNKEHEQKITMQIEDLEAGNGVALGTRVTISFPVL
ncbi:hypothetical protein A3860_35520 [Niastella vici]|uniref:Signal transduction histidine kinase internal region domain-containing protein n=1 Tax=Niastella vici TaxID=1703345 RepID=A0A1V9FNL7_9BACT|nr:two-component regulator propeller domain-containing protein [Niastella vici]OQP59954.1 hypothetical protein A3860_35520 [Niastella vici]